MYLCIDTTSSAAGITITGKKPVYIKIDSYQASEKIIETIDEVLKKAGAELKNLKGVFVIKGPGSFTGLRVGIAVANQFAHQLKIPIIGLRTDEWWSKRTDEKEFVYLQSMNKDEIYIFDFRFLILDSKFKNLPQGQKGQNSKIGTIISLSDLIQSAGTKKIKWFGELSDEHRKKLPSSFQEITDLLSPEEVWNKIVQTTKDKQLTTYELAEPFYGKEPTITKSKKKLSI